MKGGIVQIIDGNPTKESLEKIAKILGVDMYELFVEPISKTFCPHCGKQIKIKLE